MNNAYTQISTRKTPQTEPILGEKMIPNSAGGYVYDVGDWQAFERFLILGSEGGTYYISEKKLTKENAVRTMSCISQDGIKAVRMIVEVSDGGRALKNDPAIFALAIACSAADPKTRAFALSVLPKVCRIPTHLFHFLTYVKQFRGFGRGLKTAVGNWYQSMPVQKLAYEVVKYQQRDGWSNADALRLSHPKATDQTRNIIYKWIVDGMEGIENPFNLPSIIRGFEGAKSDQSDIVTYIKEYNLSREMIPTACLNSPEVWEALLPGMGYTALLRNLGNLSKCGLLKPLSHASRMVVDKLLDAESLRKARIHPIAVLLALKIYGQGKGMKGSGEWTVVPAVKDALDEAFYLAFRVMEPTGKRLLFGIDVSRSMTSPIMGLPISSCEAAAAMAMACIRSEKDYYVMGFAASFRDLGITSKMTLQEAMRKAQDNNFGRTDCSLPMVWALKNRVEIDGVVVITDNETYAGNSHPQQALRSYREKMGIQLKEVVIGTCATSFTIADPNDPLTMDVVGFDSSVPQAISEFMRA